MPRDGSGNMALSKAAFVSGTTISSSDMNADLSDIAAELTRSLASDGQTVPTANLPMGGFKHTGVGASASRTDYARTDQVIASVLDYAIDTGTATAFAIAPSPGISAYVVGQRFAFKATHANSGADPTLAVNSLTAGIIYWPNGTSLAASDIANNSQVVVQVATVSAGTPTFHLQTVATPTAGRGANTFTGTQTMSGAAINMAQGADIASATTTDIGAATGNYVKITGTTTITGLGTVQAGTARFVEFTGALTLTHNATSLILPGGQNIITAAGDCAIFVSEGSGNWRCLGYQYVSANAGQLVSTISTGVATGTTQLPADDTIPQNTEGDQYMSLAITPRSAASKLEISVVWSGATSYAGVATITAALFQDSTANALACAPMVSNAASGMVTIAFKYTMTAGTTSSTTFKVRAGANGANTTTCNGAAGGRFFGGVMTSSITIREVLP